MSKITKWTNEEIKFIKSNYPKKGVKYCAKELGRTENSVRNKAGILKLRLKKKPLLVVSRAKTSKKSKVSKKSKSNASKKRLNNYSNANGVNKQKARDKMKNAIKVNGTILSLPFSSCELEKQILKNNSNAFKFLGCEMNDDTYVDMLKVIANDEVLKHSFTTYHGMIGDKIFTAKKNEYSNLILDYCGILDTFAKEIEYAIKNDIIMPGGAICVTLAKRGSSKESNIFTEVLKNFPSDMFGNEMGDVELATKLFFRDILKDGYVIEEFFNYQDDKKDKEGRPVLNKLGKQVRNAPMMLIIIRRNK